MRTLVALLAVSVLVTPALGEWYYRGEYNGWGATLMTDNGDGTFSHSIVGGAANDWTSWKFAMTAGGWDWPLSGDSWAYTDGSGNLTITLDTNVYADGWVNDDMRINVSHDGVPQWQAVGDFNSWNNNDGAWYMSPTLRAPGVYEVQGTIATPGTHYWKAIAAGSWDAIGGDARSVNGDNIEFATTVANETVIFQVDALTGVARIVPEPATLALLAAGALAIIRRRRR